MCGCMYVCAPAPLMSLPPSPIHPETDPTVVKWQTVDTHMHTKSIWPKRPVTGWPTPCCHKKLHSHTQQQSVIVLGLDTCACISSNGHLWLACVVLPACLALLAAHSCSGWQCLAVCCCVDTALRQQRCLLLLPHDHPHLLQHLCLLCRCCWLLLHLRLRLLLRLCLLLLVEHQLIGALHNLHKPHKVEDSQQQGHTQQQHDGVQGDGLDG